MPDENFKLNTAGAASAALAAAEAGPAASHGGLRLAKPELPLAPPPRAGGLEFK